MNLIELSEEVNRIAVDLEGKEEENVVLSKNQYKKQQRYLKESGHKKEKRKEERQRRRERFKEKRQNDEQPKKEVIKQEQLERLMNAQQNGIKVCIDLQYAENMSSKEIQHLSNQLKRVYGSNKASKDPFNLTFCSLKKDDQIYKICEEKITGFSNFHVTMSELSVSSEFDLSDIIYLTPDATQYLDTLSHDKVYVIGGLVDDTVQSKVSLQYSDQEGLTTRKLPISLYMEKAEAGTFKQILTVNQVFDILVKYQETNSWPVALQAGVPPRTGFVCKVEAESTVK